MSVKLKIGLGAVCLGIAIIIVWLVVTTRPIPDRIHEPSGLVFPGQVAGMRLTKTYFWPGDEARGTLIYKSPGDFASGPYLSVVIYRSALPNSSVLSDIYRKSRSRDFITEESYRPVFLPEGNDPVGLLGFYNIHIYDPDSVLVSIITVGEWRLDFVMLPNTTDKEFARKTLSAFVQKIGRLSQEASIFVIEDVPACRKSLRFHEAKAVEFRVNGDALLNDIAPQLLARSRPLCRQDWEGQDLRIENYLVYYWDDELGGYSKLFYDDQFAIHLMKVNSDKEDELYAEVLVTPNAVYLMQFYDGLPKPEDVGLPKFFGVKDLDRVGGTLGRFSRVPLNYEDSLRRSVEAVTK